MYSTTLKFILVCLLSRPALSLNYYGCFSSVEGLQSQGTYTWQSSLHCKEACPDSYIVALSSGDECYCGNVVPSGNSNDGKCSIQCTGYPTEKCGGSSFYTVYVNPDNQDNEQQSDSSSSDSDTSSDTSSQSTSSSSSSTSSSSSSSSSSSTSTSSTSSTSTSSTSSSSSTTSSKHKTTSQTSVSSQTAVVTITQSATESSSTSTSDNTETVTATPSSTSTGVAKQAHSKGLSPGAIAGIVIGSVVGLALIIGIVAFFILRLRGSDYDSYSDDEEKYDPPSVIEEHCAIPSSGSKRFSDGSLPDAVMGSQQRPLRVTNPDGGGGISPNRNQL